jgi:hypothetical protein
LGKFGENSFKSGITDHDVLSKNTFNTSKSLGKFGKNSFKSGITDLDDCDEEPLFVFLLHRTGNGTDGPTKSVQILPRPFISVHLNKNSDN